MDYIIRKKERRDCEGVAHIVTVVWNETIRTFVKFTEKNDKTIY